MHETLIIKNIDRHIVCRHVKSLSMQNKVEVKLYDAGQSKGAVQVYIARLSVLNSPRNFVRSQTSVRLRSQPTATHAHKARSTIAFVFNGHVSRSTTDEHDPPSFAINRDLSCTHKRNSRNLYHSQQVINRHLASF